MIPRRPIDEVSLRNAFARQWLQAGALDAAKRQSTVESARDRAMRALGALPEASAAQTRAKLIEPTTAASGLGSMLPQRGTPGSAALGAFGQTMSQLGGWQDKPMTFGQILGASLGKAREAYGTAEEKQAAIAEKKAAAERQAELDELNRRNIESQIEARDRPPGAVSAAGKFATDMGFTPGTPQHIEAMQKYIQKEKTSSLTALQKEAAAIFPDDPEAAAAWVKDRRERPRGTVQKAGVVLDDTGKRVGRAIFNPTPKEGEGYVSVIDDSGKTRPLAANERSVEDSLIKDLVIPQERFYTLEKEVKQSKQSIRKLDSYLDNISKSKEGVGRTADQFIALGKTFFSEILPEKYRSYSKSQLSAAIAAGELQGLIGSSRLEVVGGGVMTEQDALRIIGYLGGDVTSTQSKEVVEAQIKKILREKAENHNISAMQYNEQRAFRGGRGKTVDLVDMDRFESLDKKVESASNASSSVETTKAPAGVDQDVWDIMEPDEKALWQ